MGREIELLVRPLLERVNLGWLYLWIAFYGCSLSILAAYAASAVGASLLNVFRDGP